MATSNVEYYQKQKDLQDSILENQQKRKHLEAQLQAYCKSDQNLNKMRAVQLQSYLRRICEDEKRSKQRNAQLLRDIERMDANMASVAARREKLKHMKMQYFEYIERTYPKWLELVQQKKQEQYQQQQQHQQQQQQQYDQYQDTQQQQDHSRLHQYQQKQEQQPQHTQDQQSHQKYEPTRIQQQRQQFDQHQHEQFRMQQQELNKPMKQNQQPLSQPQQHVSAPSQQHIPVPNQQNKVQQQATPVQKKAFRTQLQYAYSGDSYQVDDRDIYDDEDNVLQPKSAPAPQASGINDREYSNLKDMQRQVQSPSQPITVHMPNVQSGHPNNGQTGKHLVPERDTSAHSWSNSEEIEVPISQPVQSVTVRQKTEPPKPVSHMVMAPHSDDDISDFGDEPDLPSGSAGLPDQQQERNPTSPVEADIEDDESEQLSAVVHPEITTSGLLKLLKYVEDDLGNALALEGYYRTRSPDEPTRKNIINKANSLGSLNHLDGELVSMVILQQLTPIVRRLPGACMLSDTVLVPAARSLTELEIRSNLHRDAQSLWDKLLEHFVFLVKNQAMGTRELAHVFVPCLVHSGSQYQERAVTVLENVIKDLLTRGDGTTSQQDSLTIDTARSSQQGAVPPLKFGSLVDSKIFSDEESSMVTQSMNTDVPKVPLNETEAYKSLVGNSRQSRNVHVDDTDNSDNELEKQIVNTLTPRSNASKPFSETFHDGPSVSPQHKSHDQSGDLETESEVSSAVAPPVYVPTGVERESTLKTMLGSTGGSSQQRKLAGLIGSDLDSDSEVPNHMVKSKHDEQDDDFFDFYE